MLSKWKIELISFLASLSMISVGFSSWNISYTVPVIETIGGTIQTDYVLKTDDYVYFTDDGITLTPYIEEGFVLQNTDKIYQTSNKGYLTLVFIVDQGKCNSTTSALRDDTLLDIECNITLKENANKFFYISSGVGSCKIDTYDLSDINATVEITQSGTIGTLTVTDYPFTTLTENGIISITLEFTLQNASDAKFLDGNTFLINTKVHGHN